MSRHLGGHLLAADSSSSAAEAKSSPSFLWVLIGGANQSTEKIFCGYHFVLSNDMILTGTHRTKYSQLSLSRSRRDPLKHFKISVL